MPDKTPMPTNDQIDQTAQLYIDAQDAVELAKKKQAEIGQQIIEMIEQHGSVPRRATKSKRIEGDDYQCTLSKGHSLEVSSGNVGNFRLWMGDNGFDRFFRKLFRREVVFVLQEGAQEFAAGIAAKLHPDRASAFLSFFHRCLTINDSSPSLKVEAKKVKDQKKKAEAAA